MIRLRLGVVDVQRIKFACSPLTEVAESLYRLHDSAAHPLFEPWLVKTRQITAQMDSQLLRAVVPPSGGIANFLVAGAVDDATTIDDQLRYVGRCSPDRLRDDLQRIWRCAMPSGVQAVLAGDDLPQRLVEGLTAYWRAALEPIWPRMRDVLDADITYRTSRFRVAGLAGLIGDLHPEIHMNAEAIEVLAPAPDSDHDLHGLGLILVPCVFAWPDLIVDPGRTGNPSVTYGARGSGALSPADAVVHPADVLAALVGRTRAAILQAAEIPVTTTGLARSWGQSASGISAHLTALRDSGLLTSWRSGRRVLYQRTTLGTRLVTASRTAALASGRGTAHSEHR